MSGRRAGIDRFVEREEERLERQLNDGQFSEAEYNRRMNELQREAREAYTEAYTADEEDAEQALYDEWGY